MFHVTASDDTSEPKAILLNDAALLAGRSITWVRRHRRFGSLVAADIAGRQAVTSESLSALLQRISRSRRRPQLRLVIDNTK